jgi:gluconokinase
MNEKIFMNATLGVDIGTTGCRSVVYSDQAELVSSSEKLYPTLSPKPGWAEQEPIFVIHQVEESIREAVAKAKDLGYDVTLMSFSAVNHGLIPMGNGVPLRPLIIWADNRSTEITEAWKAEGLKEEFYNKTCCPLHPMYLPGKLAWLRQYEPDIFKKADRFISLKEFLFFRWFGKYVIDTSIATSSGLFNVHQMTWDEAILNRIGVQTEQLSEIVPTTEVFEGLKEETIKQLGLNPRIKVVIGAGDGVLSSLGAGAVDPGEVTVMIGTSGAARITVAKPTLDRLGRTWCYYLSPNAWVVGGAINNAGLTLQWVRQNWLKGISFEEVEEMAVKVSAGSDGLMLMPFLTGERSPNWDPNIRAALIGLDFGHGPGHFARAAMEGVAYRIRSVYEPIQEMAGTVISVRTGGGFMASPTWVQILANVLDHPLQALGEPQGSAFGAVLLGWIAVGKISSLNESKRFMKVNQVIEPQSSQVDLYQNEYKKYCQLYQKLYSE